MSGLRTTSTSSSAIRLHTYPSFGLSLLLCHIPSVLLSSELFCPYLLLSLSLSLSTFPSVRVSVCLVLPFSPRLQRSPALCTRAAPGVSRRGVRAAPGVSRRGVRETCVFITARDADTSVRERRTSHITAMLSHR